MDRWARRDCLASLCPSWTKGTQRRHRSNEEEEEEDSIFLSFFLSSFSDCVRWRFERFERAGLLPHKRNGNLGVVPPLARSLDRAERSFQSAKYSNRQTRDGNGIAKVEPRRVSERAREGERAGAGGVVAAHAQFTVNGGCK